MISATTDPRELLAFAQGRLPDWTAWSPEDPRVPDAIAAARAALETPCATTAYAAYVAAQAAYVAAYAAAKAGRADAHARVLAYAAAKAARAAGDATFAAARAAAAERTTP